MRLNPDCIRDILLTIDTLAIPNTSGHVEEMRPEDIFTAMNSEKYTQNEVLYTISCLCEEGFLKKGKQFIIDSSPRIADITPKGYQFIDFTKSDDSWMCIKNLFQTAISKGLEVSATALYNVAINNVLNI